jgi:hypothetical protein
MQKRVCMSDPVELKRELGELLIERKRLNAWKYEPMSEKDMAANPVMYQAERFLADYVMESKHAARIAKIDACINVIAATLLYNEPKNAGESV